MAKRKRILAIDVGASKVVLAEFEIARNQPPELSRYAISHLEIEPEKDSHAPATLVATIRELMRENGIKPATLYLSISGQAVFPRFVKLPPVSKDKLYQIVRYEAEQNVPFPIDEVVWDYQLLQGESDADVNVMLVAVKIETVMKLTDAVQTAHLEPRVVDAAPLALYNTVNHNYTSEEGCTLVLDIGARSSNLIFVEENRIFSRSVPVAGNAITQEIAKQFGTSFEEAEEAKKTHSQVDLGGNYEGPGDETGQGIAKVVRTVMTRLHAEVNRSINFYRSQQQGNMPSRALLTGGTSVMTYTDVFFQEKLKVPVEYLNPFAHIAVGPEIDEEQISGDVHLLGEVTGLALREAGHCPVEINLMPPDLVAIKIFRRRQPFFAGAAIAVVVALLAGWGYSLCAHSRASVQLGLVQKEIDQLAGFKRKLDQASVKRVAVETKANTIADAIDRRTRWIGILEELHTALLDGMWLTAVKPAFDNEGSIVDVNITGKAFVDRMREYDGHDMTPIEFLTERIRSSPSFTTNSAITAEPPPDARGYFSEFKLRVALARPIPYVEEKKEKKEDKKKKKKKKKKKEKR